jgi:hypothetical protein
MKRISDSEVLDKLLLFNKEGYPKGYEINHSDFPLKFGLGTCTDITGYPFFGKSLILKEIMVSLAMNHHWKFAIFMPDDGSKIEVIANLIHKMSGKTIEPGYHNSMTPKEISKWYMTAAQHFVQVSEAYAEPKAFWNFAKEQKCNAAVIDSWNYMQHTQSAVNTDYLRDILSYRNVFMQENKMHSFIIIHPKNPDPKKVKEGSAGFPTVYDLMGGSEWNNNGRNLIVVGKQNKSDYSEPYAVRIEKVKPKHYGVLGEYFLHLKWDKQRFYTVNNDTQELEFAYGKSEVLKDPMQGEFETIIEGEPF